MPGPEPKNSFKVVYVTRLRQGVPLDQSRRLWTELHGPTSLKLAGLDGYVQNHVVGAIGTDGLSDGPVAFDGYSCEWWRDRAALEAALGTAVWEELVQEGLEIFDVGSMDGMCAVLEERVMRDGPSSPFKVAWFIRFKEGMALAEAADHWLNVHGPLALEVPGVDRYVQNLVVSSVGVDGVGNDPVKFHGFSECWYQGEAAYRSGVGSEIWDRLYEDGLNFINMEGPENMSAVVEERVIK